MKKTKILGLFFLLLLLLLAGCDRKKTNEKEYTVYYVNTAGTRLVENSYSPTAETFDEMMAELMNQLTLAPSEYVSALPRNVKFLGYERGIDALRIDFSKEYYDMSNTEEVLFRAAVVKTVCQIPGVMKVMITVEKEQAKDSEGEPIPAMDINTFIDTKEGGINSYLYATLVLYFAGEEGELSVQEMRNIHYSSNMVLERLVVEELIKGPETSGLNAVLDENVRIHNIYTQNGICTINFDESVNKTPSEATIDPETALYAIVNSICETCDSITGVKFEINGDNETKFRDKIDLGQIFMKNDNLIEKDVMETEEEPDASVAVAAETEKAARMDETDISDTITDTAEPSDMTEQHIVEVPVPGNPIAGMNPAVPEG